MSEQKIPAIYNLSEKAAELYVAALELGICSIADLSRKSGVKRSTIYPFIDELVAKRLFIRVPKGKRILFKPEEPKSLITGLEEYKKQNERVLTDLQQIYEISEKSPSARYYEGKEGFIRVWEELSRSGDAWALWALKKYYSVITDKETVHLNRVLARSGGLFHNIIEDSEFTRDWAKKKRQWSPTPFRILPKGYKIEADMAVNDQKIGFFSYDTMRCIIIDDKYMANVAKMIIKILWDSLKEEI